MEVIDITKFNIHNPPYPWIKFPRKKKVQNNYNKFLSYLDKNNIDINEYISKNIIGDNIIKFCKNDFPYNIKNYRHYVLWINPNIKIQIPINIINYYIYSKINTNKYIIFENYGSNKSVMNIKHYHVFYLK